MQAANLILLPCDRPVSAESGSMQVTRNAYWLRAPDCATFHSLRPWCSSHAAQLHVVGLAVTRRASTCRAAFTLANTHKTHVAFWVRLQVLDGQVSNALPPLHASTPR